MHFRICCATTLVIFCPQKDFVMHRHITYYTQSTVCQGEFSNKFLSSSSWAYAGFAKGGHFFFFGGGGRGLATRGVAMRLLGGLGACFPENFFRMVHFGAYFHKLFTFKKSKNVIFIQIFINCSHVLARGSRSMVHSPLIVFIKGYNL